MRTNPPPQAEDTNAQILALVKHLQETEQRLQSLIRGDRRATFAPPVEKSLLAEAREHLRRSDSLMRMAGRAARLGAWSLEASGNCVVWSDEVCAIHDMPLGTQPSLEEAVAYYAPESRPGVREAVAGCLETGKPFEIEAAIVTATGRRLWVRALGEAVRGPDGHNIGVQGAIQDITLSKSSEETLRANEVSLRTLAETQAAILNALPANIALINGQGLILSVNDRWRNFGGDQARADPSATVGRNYLKICDDATGDQADGAPQIAAGIRAVLRGAMPKFECEYPCHAPGEERWFRLTVNPLVGAPSAGAVVMHVEVTDQRRAEESSRQSEQRCRSLFNAAATGIAICVPACVGSLLPERIAAAGVRQLLLKPATLHALGLAVQAGLAQPEMATAPAGAGPTAR